MAKINWVFQDEQGTNLNRYRAINVNTREEVVFDLLRNGSISVIGTPLNAEKLNQLVTAINSNYDGILNLKSNVSTINSSITNINSSITNINNDIKNIKNDFSGLAKVYRHKITLYPKYGLDQFSSSAYYTTIYSSSSKNIISLSGIVGKREVVSFAGFGDTAFTDGGKLHTPINLNLRASEKSTGKFEISGWVEKRTDVWGLTTRTDLSDSDFTIKDEVTVA